jgi:hypothetical protein
LKAFQCCLQVFNEAQIYLPPPALPFARYAGGGTYIDIDAIQILP